MAPMWMLAVLILTLVTRLVYWRYLLTDADKAKPSGGFDHAHWIVRIRENKGFIPKDAPDRPLGMHKLLSLFSLSESQWQKFGGLVPVLCDTISIFWLAFIVFVTGGTEMIWFLILPLIRLFWGEKSRAFLLNTSAFSMLAANVVWGSLLLYADTQNQLWLLEGVIGMLILMTSSRSSWLAVGVSSLLVTAIMKDNTLILLFLVLSVGAIVLSLGYAYKVQKQSVAAMKVAVSEASEWAVPRKGFLAFFFEHPAMRPFTNNPLVLPFLFQWYYEGYPNTVWTVAAVCGLILTLLVYGVGRQALGNPARYAELAILPMLVALTHASIYSLRPPVLILLGVTGLIGLLSFIYQLRLRRLAQA